MKLCTLLGIAIGLTVGGLAVSAGDPSFFTSEHAGIWHEHLATRGLLPGPIAELRAVTGGANSRVSQWGY